MKFVHCLFSLVFTLFAAFVLPVPAWATALYDYVAAPDSNYSYIEVDSVSDFFTSAYTLKLTSQGWRDSSEVAPVVWTYWITVYKPTLNLLIGTDNALLLINGGDASDPQPAYDQDFRDLSLGTGSVIAVLSAVPNQPLQFSDELTPRSEDEIIAYSWDKYLNGGDAYWPLQKAGRLSVQLHR